MDINQRVARQHSRCLIGPLSPKPGEIAPEVVFSLPSLGRCGGTWFIQGSNGRLLNNHWVSSNSTRTNYH
jgi:hypothetical protein